MSRTSLMRLISRATTSIPVLASSATSSPSAGVDLQAVIRQAKVISQIIAYLWLHPESEMGKKGIKWFQFPKNSDGSPNGLPHFQNLLTIGNPNGGPGLYNDFLREVFSHLDFCDRKISQFYQFPIYNIGDETDTIGVSFEVDNTAFHGHFKDPNPNSPNLFTVVVAFPPRPQFGATTFTEETLKQWQTNTDSKVITPPSAYIPTCSC
ncbi:MAG: hypothetical protein F6K24_18175 [Okeania sp. SIO2D1]|nr:hypothetical protein [Okeania sp. SIO2D1]